MRFLNIVITISLILLYANEISIKTLLFILCSTLLLIFANLQNDYFDREIDAKKGIRRVILSPFYQFLILFVSLIISFFIELRLFLLFLLMFILISYYNIFGSKKPFGFLITSLIISIGVLSLGMVFGFRKELIYLVIFSFLFNIIREVVKSYIDYEYDFGIRKTIAIFLSKNKTRILIKFLLIFLFLSLIFVSIILNNIYFSLYGIFSGIIFFLYILNLFSEKVLSKILKFLMFLGFLILFL